MPFRQDLIAGLLVNRSKFIRYAFIPQLLVALPFLGFAYKTGNVHARLLIHGIETQGKIVGSTPVLFQNRSSSSSFSGTAYMPIVVFRAGDRLVQIEEWKGSSSRPTAGSLVPVLYDPSDTSIAMMDRGLWNWLPWAPCCAIGFVLGLASLNGFFGFLFRRAPEPNSERQMAGFERFARK